MPMISFQQSSSDEEAFVDLKTLQAQGDLPQEFWQVQLNFYLALQK